VFRGRGWDGIESHWRAHHEQVQKYEDFFHGLCPEHRRAKPPLLASAGDDLKNEARTVTRFFTGRTVRAVYRYGRDEVIVESTDGSRLIIGIRGDELEVSIQE
jgi:hypothetical protein